MIYSQLYLKNKLRIPTFVTLLLILLLVILFTRFFTDNSFPTRASSDSLKRIEIANLTPYQVSVYWQTDKKEIGWLIYGENENRLSNLILDERDISDSKTPYRHHFVTIRNLKENQRYYFKLIGNTKIFSFTTPANIQKHVNISPAYGKIIKSNGKALDNGVVILTFKDSIGPIITLSKSTGEWLAPLNNVKINSESPIRIEVMSEEGEKSTIMVNPDQLSPVPQTVVLGENYNLAESKADVLSVQTDVSDGQNNLKILYPKENAMIPGHIPLIKGGGRPFSQVLITVNSTKTYTARITVGADGSWSYVLPDKLELGKHTITVFSQDEKGEEVKLVRNFIIIGYEGGDARVMGVSTGDPVVSGAPTATPTPYSALPTSTPIPTYAVTPTSAESTPTPSVPVSGISNFILPAIGGASLIIVGMGIILAF